MRRLFVRLALLVLFIALGLVAYWLLDVERAPPEIDASAPVSDAATRPVGPCLPDCAGKTCGADGCGGACGVCRPGARCEIGRCVTPPPICGDHRCDPKESCIGCAEDCPCLEGARCDFDLARCVCASQCEATLGQNQPRECGPDGCGGHCGRCPAWQICDDGRCVCAPKCEGKACGPDGCGGECGACPEGAACSAQGRCVPESPRCGDGRCRDGEDCMICPEDCGECCGDRRCLGDESCLTCPQDCGACCGDGVCGQGESCANCARDCRCLSSERCDEALEVCACQPSCRGARCGPDGCGGLCGACPEGERCGANRRCVASDQACGDGACQPGEGCLSCPQDCGACCGNGVCDPHESCVACPADCACPQGQVCDSEAGRCACVPSCVARSCGSDGCGGLCGVCRGDARCEAGRCVCTPRCKGRQCGGDGCGG
ncbi:hypothetical protein KKB55_08810, partial [Myxococcota bacterium]|nr:hypothetical protein [Myxococcota bacterium]